MTHLGITEVAPRRLFPDLYEQLLWRLLKRGDEEVNERTGHSIKSLPPTSFCLDLEDGLLPVAGNRKLFPATAAAEVAWMLMGTQDASFMLRHAKVVWEKFVEPDWVDPAVPAVKAAYGYRWRRHFGRDQIGLALEALAKNPSDRRVWVSAWDPASDGLGAAGQLNVPCPVGFSLSIAKGRLNCSLVLRSSDVFVGLPYDVMGQSMLMAVLAAQLGVGLGFLHVTLAHPHLYDSHYGFAEESLVKHQGKRTEVRLVNWTLPDVEHSPDKFVALYKTLGQEQPWPEFCPRPEVIP